MKNERNIIEECRKQGFNGKIRKTETLGYELDFKVFTTKKEINFEREANCSKFKKNLRR